MPPGILRHSRPLGQRSLLIEWVALFALFYAAHGSLPCDSRSALVARFNSHWLKDHDPHYPASASISSYICYLSKTKGGFVIGKESSLGLQELAEHSHLNHFTTELRADPDVLSFRIGPGLPENDETSHTEILMPLSHGVRYISCLAAIRPSPDWLIGFQKQVCADDAVLIRRYRKNLEVFDTGTDSGTTYTSLNNATFPKGVIQLARSTPVNIDLQNYADVDLIAKTHAEPAEHSAIPSVTAVQGGSFSTTTTASRVGSSSEGLQTSPTSQPQQSSIPPSSSAASPSASTPSSTTDGKRGAGPTDAPTNGLSTQVVSSTGDARGVSTVAEHTFAPISTATEAGKLVPRSEPKSSTTDKSEETAPTTKSTGTQPASSQAPSSQPSGTQSSTEPSSTKPSSTRTPGTHEVGTRSTGAQPPSTTTTSTRPKAPGGQPARTPSSEEPASGTGHSESPTTAPPCRSQPALHESSIQTSTRPTEAGDLSGSASRPTDPVSTSALGSTQPPSSSTTKSSTTVASSSSSRAPTSTVSRSTSDSTSSASQNTSEQNPSSKHGRSQSSPDGSPSPHENGALDEASPQGSILSTSGTSQTEDRRQLCVWFWLFLILAIAFCVHAWIVSRREQRRAKQEATDRFEAGYMGQADIESPSPARLC